MELEDDVDEDGRLDFVVFDDVVDCRLGSLLTQCFQPSKSINACIHPHSIVFCSSHLRFTGLVKKSLQPAAKASDLSASEELAVNATIITGDRNSLVSKTSSVLPTAVSVLSETTLEKTPIRF